MEMQVYEGHRCTDSCKSNGGTKNVVSCWSCEGVWYMECLKDEKADINSWLHNRYMIPRANLYLQDEACIRFICPVCLHKRMRTMPFIEDSSNIAANEVISKLVMDLANFKSEFSYEMGKNEEKMNAIINLVTATESSYIHGLQGLDERYEQVLTQKLGEVASHLTVKMDKMHEMIEDSKNSTIGEIATLLNNHGYGNLQNAHELNQHNKRPRIADNVGEMNGLLDLSVNMSCNNDQINSPILTPRNEQQHSGGLEVIEMNSAGANRPLGMVNTNTNIESMDLQTIDATSQKQNVEQRYEVFVSKFHPNETEVRIIQHIYKCAPEIADSDICVKKLVSSKMNTKEVKYVSFLISTKQEYIQTALLNPNLWKNAVARQFFPNRRMSNYTRLRQNTRNVQIKRPENNNIKKDGIAKRNQRKQLYQQQPIHANNTHQFYRSQPQNFIPMHVPPPLQNTPTYYPIYYEDPMMQRAFLFSGMNSAHQRGG